MNNPLEIMDELERDSYRMPERRDFYDEADHRYEEQRQEEVDNEH